MFRALLIKDPYTKVNTRLKHDLKKDKYKSHAGPHVETVEKIEQEEEEEEGEEESSTLCGFCV